MIVVLQGPIGSGKTLAAVAFSVMEKNKTGKKILSNIHLEKVEHQYFSSDDFIGMVVDNDKLEDCSIILDGAYLFTDSRNTQSKLNKLFTYLVVKNRMKAVDIYITTVDIKDIDVRIRRSADLIGRCSYDIKSRLCNVYLSDPRTDIAKEVHFDFDEYFKYYKSYDIDLDVSSQPINRIVENIEYSKTHNPKFRDAICKGNNNDFH
jgi:zona occludens toxin (predicted ATPase)